MLSLSLLWDALTSVRNVKISVGQNNNCGFACMCVTTT